MLLDVTDLQTHFFTPRGVARAVDGVSLSLDVGQTLGLVGESGCGKSVTSLSIMRLVAPPGRIVSGRIAFDGRDLLELSEDEMRAVRGNDIAMIFQDPMTSLNPVFTIGDQIAEAVRLHAGLSRRASWERAVEMLALVSIPDPGRRARNYPYEMSGGMRQRAMIAMALSCSPKLLVADEPTTALDVTIQAQILELLARLQREMNLGLLLITHDLGVVAEVCDDVAVMYAGQIVEQGSAREIFGNPGHPYTEGLLRSVPRLRTAGEAGPRRLQTIDGVVPSLLDLPAGCRFAPRCEHRVAMCDAGPIPLYGLGDEHAARCTLYDPQRTDADALEARDA
jgi:peptide/nickel transport system ATP-binding protein/oligopeptide transport system ATP-binding protein